MSFLESAALVQIGKNSREAELITARGDAEIAEMRYNRISSLYQETMILGKAQVHNMRARRKAYVAVGKEMGEVIAKYEPDNPLSDPIGIEKKVDALHIEYVNDPDVIKQTYPDGKIEGDPCPIEVVENDPMYPGRTVSVSTLQF